MHREKYLHIDMSYDELVENVAKIVVNNNLLKVPSRTTAEEIIETIRAALQEPNAEMIKALWSANASRGWPEAAKTCWQSVLAASALGEKSE